MNNEKKKTAVVACLFAVILCIGGFQFIGKKGGTLPIDKKDKKDAVTVPVDPGPKNPQVSNDLPARDPFEIPADQIPVNPNLKKPTVSPINTLQTFKSHGHGGFVGELPPASIGTAELSKISGSSFSYRMVGSISGRHPAVLLADATGNQKLVPVGAAIDGDSHVESMTSDSVFIVCRGKRLRLSMGGNPLEK